MFLGGIAGATGAGGLLAAVQFTDFLGGIPRLAMEVILGILFCVLLLFSLYCVFWYRTFSYRGKTQLSRRIIEQIAQRVTLPENGRGLDVGCGSGALTIACAKQNPQAQMVGLDRWGKEYASFHQILCERNAELEGVSNRTTFLKGDACRLPFPDQSFDAITSNYCYHNIPVKDRQAVLLENLRVLRKGGHFVLHDLFTRARYGDMDAFLRRLQAMGFEKVELLDTTDGLIMTKKDAKWSLAGSKLLIGIK